MKKYAIITMDVEDWYHTYFPEANVDRSISLLDGLDVALDIMKKDDIHGSFFVVGEIADKLADKLRAMDKEGHDIAVHNCQHLRPVTMAPDEFRSQLLEAKQRSKEFLDIKFTVTVHRALALTMNGSTLCESVVLSTTPAS